MDTQNPDKMLPYLIIARFNGLRKDNPDDPENMVWVAESGERYILTPKGFSHAVLLNYNILYDGLKREYDKLTTDYTELQRKYDHYKQVHQSDDIIGKGSKKKIKSIINSNNFRTIEEKFEAIRQYLKMANP